MDNQSIITLIGLLAGFLTTFAALPQVYRIWRTRKTTDLSVGTYLLLVAGIVLWLAYAILISDIPLLAANGVGLFFNALILFFKIKYG